jgi:hypothetical protein
LVAAWHHKRGSDDGVCRNASFHLLSGKSFNGKMRFNCRIKFMWRNVAMYIEDGTGREVTMKCICSKQTGKRIKISNAFLASSGPNVKSWRGLEV